MVVFFADRLLKLKKYRTQSMKTSQPSNISSKTKVHRHLPLGFSPSVSVAACYLEIGGKLLLLLRAKEKSEGGKWGVPAGKIEANEEPIDAGLRELGEGRGRNGGGDGVGGRGRGKVSKEQRGGEEEIEEKIWRW